MRDIEEVKKYRAELVDLLLECQTREELITIKTLIRVVDWTMGKPIDGSAL